MTPSDERTWNAQDWDLGSGGPICFQGAGVLVGGKDGNLYALDRAQLGKFQAGRSGALRVWHFRDGIYSAPAYWNGRVYVLARKDYLFAFPVKAGKFADKPEALGKQRFLNSGGTPAISADGTRNGIVWLIETKEWNGADRPAVLHAYDAGDVAARVVEQRAESRPRPGGLTLRFTIPTVVDGRVYVDGKRRVDVYGLLPVGGRLLAVLLPVMVAMFPQDGPGSAADRCTRRDWSADGRSSARRSGQRDVQAFRSFGLAPSAVLQPLNDHPPLVIVDDFEQ